MSDTSSADDLAGTTGTAGTADTAGIGADGLGAGAANASDHPDLTRPSEPGSGATEADGSLGQDADVAGDALPQDAAGLGSNETDGNRGGAAEPSIEDTIEQPQGNGSFDDASEGGTPDSDEARMASDAGGSAQDAGSMS